MNRLLVITALVAVLASIETATAQTTTNGTIAAHGSTEIKRLPEFLRVQIEVLAKGKDIQEALAKLKDRREAIKIQLKKLDAAPDTIAFGETMVGGEKNDQQKRLEMMIGQRLRSAGKSAEKAKPQTTAVAFNLKFDVPVKAADTEELLVIAQQLQARIKNVDLAGLKEFEKLTPQEEELAEEAKMAEGMAGQEEVKSGEPSFLFVSKMTKAELAKSLAEAFAKAKEEAGLLAAAAAVELGPLQHLEAQNQQGADEEALYGRYNQAYALRMQMATTMSQPREAVSVRPGLVTYRVGVVAQFQVKAK